MPDRAGPAGTGRVHRDHRAGLGAPVALQDLAAGHPPLPLLPGLRRERRGAAVHVAQRGQVEVLQRLGEQHLDHRGHQRRALNLVPLGQGQELRRIEPALQHAQGALGGVESDQGHDHAVGVRQRQRRQRPGDPLGLRGLVRTAGAGVQVAVREHDALRPAGRAAGVHERRQVVVADGHDAAARGGLKFGEVDPANMPGKRVGRAADDDHVPQLRRARRRGGHRRQQLGGGHHGHRAGVGQDVLQFGRADQEHNRGDHRTRPPDRAVGDAHLRAVRHQHHDPLAGRHPELRQPRRHPAGPVEQVARPVGLALENEALVVAEPMERAPRPRRRDCGQPAMSYMSSLLCQLPDSNQSAVGARCHA